MAERLLKKGDGAARTAKVAAKEKVAAKTAKVAAKGDDATTARQIVLVATYKERQLAWIKKNGVYNYPAKDGDEFDADAFARIKELWLYADAKGRRHCFAAEFAGKMTRDEFLAAYPSYAKLGKSRSKAYYVFKTSFLTYGPSLENPDVLTRAADFGGRSAKVKKAIAAFKADGAFGSLADYLPFDLSQVPHDHLCVCEAAVQLDFLEKIEDMRIMQSIPRDAFTAVELFAGAGGLSIGLEKAGIHVVIANEIMPDFAATLVRNHPRTKVINEDIHKIDFADELSKLGLTSVDVLSGGPPCQGFSTIGSKNRKDPRNSLFYEYLRAVSETHPKYTIFENVSGFKRMHGMAAA